MVLVCILISILLMLSPISVSAYEIVTADPVEPSPTFHGYEVLGYDIEGNAELSGEDYHDYVNSILSVPDKSRSNSVPDNSISTMALDDLDETKFTDKTRFISSSDWKSWVSDWVFNTIKGIATTPTTSANLPTTVSTHLNSVGKMRLYYGYSGKYELVRCELTYDQDNTKVTYKITRSFAGALYTYYVYGLEGTSIVISWSSDGYAVKSSSNTIYGAKNIQNPSSFPIVNIRMRSYSVNSLPTINLGSSFTTAVPDDSNQILGQSNNTRDYAENTFETNDYTYNLNHSNVTGSNKYWNPAVIYLPNYIPIASGTVINQTNINNYAEYGYTWNDTTNSIDVDMNVLTAWVENKLIPQLELVYKDAYQKFPDIDANITDQDITYVDPFEEPETEPPGTLPPSTLPPGSGGGGMTPGELDGVLNQESFYIMDMETALPPVMFDTLPDVNLPAELSSGAVGLSNFVIDLFDSLGILPVFVSLSVLAFVVFTLKGG